MANIYVRSTDGNNADNGSTWALAKATLAGADAIDAAGDTIYVSQAHAESTTGAVTLAFAGTLASPTRVICGNDAAEPPTAVAAAATVGSTGTITINQGGGALYVYGITFSPGNDGALGVQLVLASSTTPSGVMRFANCGARIANSGSAFFQVGSAGSSNAAKGGILLEDFDLRVPNTGNRILVYQDLHWKGGAIISGSAAVNYLISVGAQGRSSLVLIEAVDFANLGAAFNFVQAASIGKVVIRNCKLPSSWSGALVQTGTRSENLRVEMWNCDDGDTNYRMWVESFAGSIRSETTIVRSGGASDGTTPLSWKMASTADAAYPLVTLDSPEIVCWNDATGSAITVTVEVITDNVTLTDAECWLEVQYLGTSGFPLGVFVSDCKADILATAANQTSSSETWTTTGLGTPVKQALSVTFTPQEKGYVHAVVKLAKASTTVYVDPLLTVT